MGEPRARVFYEDDSNEEVAGLGLAYAPYVEEIVGAELVRWAMSPAEQVGLTYLLERRKPGVAIEIGTRFGGSLQVIARLAKKVYSLDIDPGVRERLAGRFPNVEFLTGPSDVILPPLLEKLQAESADLGFVLIDGDHTTEGVRKDIDNILRWKPIAPVDIVMHDSFNAVCRRGLRAGAWGACKYIDFVELDYVSGDVNTSRLCFGELWGGLALARMLPEPRNGRFEITAKAEESFRILNIATSRSFASRIAGRLRRMFWVKDRPPLSA
jgi:hypothetical protein